MNEKYLALVMNFFIKEVHALVSAKASLKRLLNKFRFFLIIVKANTWRNQKWSDIFRIDKFDQMD